MFTSMVQALSLWAYIRKSVDNGNNNNLNTSAKVNYLPYGIDFPQGPTGRFTNGKNIADLIGELLGFQNYIPPDATARNQDVFTGVNYGSGAAGILDETGHQMVMGSNDYLNNYYLAQFYSSSNLYTPEEFAAILIRQYSKQLTEGSLFFDELQQRQALKHAAESIIPINARLTKDFR
ncbi:Hypothetical predicted protein [Olea europaea subsp. europaea]|uniref:Uncharacterized protein n=1 Tax=Olea europaea subsp. europaea TaxID=158383 RepID=A0A8S0QB22_OLEEU|nr:Hypothetical predicted protein [Olea europaea subsp. europaea]